MKLSKIAPYIYIILISIVGFIYNKDVIDIVGFQWLYLNLINILAVFYLYFFRFSDIKNSLNLSLKNLQFFFYLGYLIISIFSLVASINIPISLIAISKLGTILIILFILNNFDFKYDKLLKFIPILMSVILTVEVGMSLAGYFEIIKVTDFKFSMAQDFLKGTASNKNITSASIAFKIPFVYILMSQLRSAYLRILLIIALSFSFFNLILLSSRAILVSYSLVLIALVTGLFILFYKNLGSEIKSIFQKVFNFLLPFIISIVVFSYVNTDNKLEVGSRVASINTDDVSSTTRLRYYKKGLEYFISNPLIGCGIGNWQLISIDLDSDNIESYIVPYVAHNDFIEILTETGIFGGLFYFLFVLINLFFLVKIFFGDFQLEKRVQSLYLLFPFIIYFIDSNLNFPQYRPIMQIAFILFSFYIYNFYKNTTCEKSK